ncbi:MAG: lipoprotein [Candidatus Omnitrophota bacterium]|nr:lipoprotein [Candidatus Omnitrophota bacterium]
MKKILFMIFLVFLLSGCVSVNPYVLTKGQTSLDLTNNRGVALFTLKADNSGGGARLLLSSFMAREVNQYKPYNTLGVFSLPLMGENYSTTDNLYFCSVVLSSGIYRLDSFNGVVNPFFAMPAALKIDKIFDIYPNKINYLGRLNFSNVDTKSVFTPLISAEDTSEQDIIKFKEIFPILKDRQISMDSFY